MATSKAPFKIGDVVEVIPEHAHPLLVIGKQYTVKEVCISHLTGQWFVELGDSNISGMYANRFKLVDEFEGNV
jgi:hypothetical protein